MRTNLGQLDGQRPGFVPKAFCASGSGSFPPKKGGNTDSKIKEYISVFHKPTISLVKRLMFAFRHISVLPLNSVWAAQWAIERALVAVFQPIFSFFERGRNE